MDRAQVEAALKAGIITADQAEKLLAGGYAAAASPTIASVPKVAAPAAPEPVDPDDEKFRILGGFNDVFVAIGVALLYGALLLLGGSVAPVLLSVIGALAAWGLAEVFSRRMRLALPSIMLAMLFAFGVGTSVLLAYAVQLSSTIRPMGLLTDTAGVGGMLAGGATMLAAWLHHRRFGVPIDWAIGAGGGVLALFGLLGILLGPRILVWTNELLFVAGLAIFVFAMSLDMSDPFRRTRRSDAAFWMHLMAAPMLVHPLVSAVAGSVWSMTTGKAAVILALFAVIALIALVIDRRALLVSSLIYTGSAVVFLIQQVGVGGGQATLAATLLSLAVVVLSLSAFWRAIRSRLIPLLPLGVLASKLPPANAQNV
jgi:hypothetical protein